MEESREGKRGRNREREREEGYFRTFAKSQSRMLISTSKCKIKYI